MNPEEIQKQLNNLATRIDGLIANPLMPDHQHTGFDVTKVRWFDLAEKKVIIPFTLHGTSAATTTNYGVFFILPWDAVLIGFKEVHETAGTDGGTVTLQLEKLTGTQALDAGAEMLSTALSLKTAVNTVVSGTLSGTLANRSLKRGHRLALKDADRKSVV